jgi:hypothetical protein
MLVIWYIISFSIQKLFLENYFPIYKMHVNCTYSISCTFYYQIVFHKNLVCIFMQVDQYFLFKYYVAPFQKNWNALLNTCIPIGPHAHWIIHMINFQSPSLSLKNYSNLLSQTQPGSYSSFAPSSSYHALTVPLLILAFHKETCRPCHGMCM